MEKPVKPKKLHKLFCPESKKALFGAEKRFGPVRSRAKIPGQQVCAGNHTQKFAQQFQGTDFGAIKRAAEAIFGFKKKQIKSPAIAAQVYGQRNAEDIFATRTITTFDFGGLITSGGRASSIASTGCAEQSIAFAAFLNAKNIPFTFVRCGTHSFVKFRQGKKSCQANFLPTRVFVGKYFETTEIKNAKKRGDYAEGKDLWSIGVLGFEQFDKFADGRSWKKQK